MIDDINIFRGIIPTITAKSLDKYEQEIANATAWFRSKIVGSDLMVQILALKGSDPVDELYRLARNVVAYRAYSTAIAMNDLIEDANGFGVVNNDKLVPASTGRVRELRRETAAHLSEALDLMVEYLEDHTEYHAAWSKSPTFTIMYGSYIPTLRMFRQYGPFEGSYSEFAAALPRIRGIILKTIEPKISRELSAELIVQVRENSLSEANEKIIGDLRSALAAYYNNDQALGDTCLFHVRRYLEENVDLYPEFKNSQLYALIIRKEEQDERFKSIGVIV